MGILLDIANRAVDISLNRLDKEGGLFKEILADELQKELNIITPETYESDYITNDWDNIIEH